MAAQDKVLEAFQKEIASLRDEMKATRKEIREDGRKQIKRAKVEVDERINGLKQELAELDEDMDQKMTMVVMAMAAYS